MRVHVDVPFRGFGDGSCPFSLRLGGERLTTWMDEDAAAESLNWDHEGQAWAYRRFHVRRRMDDRRMTIECDGVVLAEGHWQGPGEVEPADFGDALKVAMEAAAAPTEWAVIAAGSPGVPLPTRLLSGHALRRENWRLFVVQGPRGETQATMGGGWCWYEIVSRDLPERARMILWAICLGNRAPWRCVEGDKRAAPAPPLESVPAAAGLGATAEEAAAIVVHCPACGRAHAAGARYCPECGRDVRLLLARGRRPAFRPSPVARRAARFKAVGFAAVVATMGGAALFGVQSPWVVPACVAVTLVTIAAGAGSMAADVVSIFRWNPAEPARDDEEPQGEP